MQSAKKLSRFIAWPGVILLQLIATQVVTFLVSFLFGDIETFPQAHPVIFMIVLGITYSIGIFLVGALAIKLRWLNLEPKNLARFVGALTGAYLLIVIGMILYGGVGPDNPFFIIISPLAGILGFYLVGWLRK